MSLRYQFMLDTNAASALIHAQASTALERLVVGRSVCISVITEAELRFGVACKPGATHLAQTVEAFLQDTPVVPWTSETARACAVLRTRLEGAGVSLSAMGLLIATQAVAAGATLLTADKAFAQVPGLTVRDWSADAME